MILGGWTELILVLVIVAVIAIFWRVRRYKL